jgi:DNA repair exonuclease SbcCD ATPase subunit
MLRNYRGVSEVEVEFPAEGVTIIEGDNEVGKTSLSEAVDLLLAERDDASKRAVKAVKPAGKDVGAEVEVEMSSGPYRFRYRKRWHRQKETVLEIFEPQKSQLTGREAHDKVRAILDETLDGGLWEALRLRQGTQLEQAAFAGGSLGRALDLAAGGDSAGEREDDLWARITTERDRYWTATGQEKSSRAASAARVAEIASRVAELEATLSGLENDAEEVDRLIDEAKVLANKQKDQEEVEAGLAKQFEAIQNHRNEVTRLAGLRDTAQAHCDRALEVSKSRANLVQRAADTAVTVGELESQVVGALPARKQVEDHLRETQQKVEVCKGQVREAEIAQRRAIDDRDYRRQQIELDQLSERRDRVMDAIRRRSEADVVIDSSHVDDELVERIEAAHVELARAEASAATGAATVNAEALADIGVEIDGRAFALGAGEQRELVVAGSTEVVVPGTIKMVVKAGAEAQVLADRLAEARAAFESVCAEGHIASLAEARKAAAARNGAERVLAETAKSIEQDLRDLTTEALAQKIERLTARVASYESERPAEPPLPPELDSAQVLASECDQLLQDRREEFERLEEDLARASTAIQEVDLGDASTKARLEQARTAAGQEQQTLDDARRVVSDEDVAKQLADAESAMLARTAELTEAETRLAAEAPDSVEELLRNARAVKKRLADDLHDNEVRTRDLRTKLALKGEEGLANKLDIAKSELAHRTGAHERLEERAAAAKLLYDTFATRRAEAHHRYVAPFRERIEQLGRLVFGRGLEVELDDDLCISRRTLDGVTLDFLDLSTGAKEQLGVISRLACASLVAADGGAPVIFDDALGWSDPRKLDRMGAVISMAGRSCQIIVLTCTPGRYASVGNATVVQLLG